MFDRTKGWMESHPITKWFYPIKRMLDRIKGWMESHPIAKWFYPIWYLSTISLFWFSPFTDNGHIWLYLGIAVLFFFVCRPNSAIYHATMEGDSWAKSFFAIFLCLTTVAFCVLPMNRLSIWNGEEPGHRNQYELMAEAILDGRIHLDYGDEDALAELENPYDPNEREEKGVQYHWDHAYYDGHYYMYFGIVPVFLLFLPYRLLTGAALTTFHATQVFVALAIIGIFILFRLLADLFFKKMPFCLYLALSVALSAMSVWYSTAEPALYCTAITSAIALQIWSLYFFVRAVWHEENENRAILFAAIGALLGALVFGCRPPIALANLVVIPMLIVFLKKRKITWKLIGKLALAALPYLLVGCALMLYNYSRFDNPFEFGQAYQLTVADQTNYRVVLDTETLLRLFNETIKNMFSIGQVSEQFPYLSAASVFYNFPILLVSVLLLKTAVVRKLHKNDMLLFTVGLAVTVFVIVAMDILWTPYLLERYRMDVYFLMGIFSFLIIGFWYSVSARKRRALLNTGVMLLSGCTVLSSFFLCIQTIGAYYPEQVQKIAQALHLV